MDKVHEAFSIYKDKLAPYIWRFEYEGGLTIELRFNVADFPHLMGLDKLNKYLIMSEKNIPGISSLCLSDLKKGKITDEMISNDKSKRMIQRRISNFEKLPVLLDDPSTQHFEFDKDLVPCSIPAEYMLYNPIDNTHCYFGTIEARNTRGSTPKRYAPLTWFIEEDRPDMYIKNQKHIKLVKVEKISRTC